MEYLEVKNTEAVNKTLHEASSSKYQMTEKFIPPSHPAYLITHNFQSQHVKTLQDQMDKHFISLGMQTSKKKLIKIPETPNDRYFIIVDDSAGPVYLEGEFLILSCRRIFYPNDKNTEQVIKQFNEYIGLGHYERNQLYENDKKKAIDEDYLKELEIRKLKNLKSIDSNELENVKKNQTDLSFKQNYLTQNTSGLQTSLGQNEGKSKIKLQGVKSMIEEKGMQKFDGAKIFVFESKDDDLAYKEMVIKLKKQVQHSKNMLFINRIDQFNFYSQRHKNEYLVLLMSSYSLLNLRSYFKKIHESIVYWTSETQRIHSNQTKWITFYSMIEKEILTYILIRHSQMNKEQPLRAQTKKQKDQQGQTPVSILKPLKPQYNKNKNQLPLSRSQNQKILQSNPANGPVEKSKINGQRQVQQKKRREPKIKLLEVTDLYSPQITLDNNQLKHAKDQSKQQKSNQRSGLENDKTNIALVKDNQKKATVDSINKQPNPYQIQEQSNKNLASIQYYEGYPNKSKIKKVRSHRKIKNNSSKNSKQQIMNNLRLNHLRVSSDKKDQSPIRSHEHKRVLSTESNQLGIPIQNKAKKVSLNFVSDYDSEPKSDYHISTHPPCEKTVTISNLNIDNEEMKKNSCKIVEPLEKFQNKFNMNDQQKYEKMMKGQQKDNKCFVLPIDEGQQKHRVHPNHNRKQKSNRTFQIVKEQKNEQKYQYKSVESNLQDENKKLMIGLIAKADHKYISGTKNISIINNQVIPPSFVQLSISSVSSFSQKNLMKKIQSTRKGKTLMKRSSDEWKSKDKQSAIRYKLNLLNNAHQEGINQIIFSDSQSQRCGDLKTGINRYSFGNFKQKQHGLDNLNMYQQSQNHKDSQYFNLLPRHYRQKQQSNGRPQNYQRNINQYGLSNNRHKQRLTINYLQDKGYESNQYQPNMVLNQIPIQQQKNSAYLNDKNGQPISNLKLPIFRSKSKSQINNLKFQNRNHPVQKIEPNLNDPKNFQLNRNLKNNYLQISNQNDLSNSGASRKNNYSSLPKYSRVKSKDNGAYLERNREELKVKDPQLHSKLYTSTIEPLSIIEIAKNEIKPKAINFNNNIIDLSEYDKCIQNGVTVYRKKIPISAMPRLVDQLVNEYTQKKGIPRQIIKTINPEPKIKQAVNFYLTNPVAVSATSYITPIQYQNFISKNQSEQKHQKIAINHNKSLHQSQIKLVSEQFSKINDAKQTIQENKVIKDSLIRQKDISKNQQKYGFIYHQKKKAKKFCWSEEYQILFLIDKSSAKQTYSKIEQLTTEKDTMVSFKNIHQLNNQILQSEVIYDLVFIFSQSNTSELKAVSKKFANCYLVRQISDLPTKIKNNRIYLNSLDQLEQIISEILNKSSLKQNKSKGQAGQEQKLKIKPKYCIKMPNPHFSTHSCCLESYHSPPKQNCCHFPCSRFASPRSLIN